MKTNNIFDIIFVVEIKGKIAIFFFCDDALCWHWRDKNIQNWRCMISILKGVPTEIPRFRNQNLRGLCDGHCSAWSIPTENHKSAKPQLKWPLFVFMWCVVIFWYLSLYWPTNKIWSLVNALIMPCPYCGFSSNWILLYFPLSVCSSVRLSVRPSQAWHLSFLIYIKA